MLPRDCEGLNHAILAQPDLTPSDLSVHVFANSRSPAPTWLWRAVKVNDGIDAPNNGDYKGQSTERNINKPTVLFHYAIPPSVNEKGKTTSIKNESISVSVGYIKYVMRLVEKNIYAKN